MSEPYAYEVRYEDADELVYASWLEKYATDAYRAAPRIPLYKEPPASTNRLTGSDIASIHDEIFGNAGYSAEQFDAFARAIIAATEGT